MAKHSLSSLNFILGADIRDFQTKMRSASTGLQRTGDQFKKVGKQMTVAITGSIAAATTGMVMLSKKAADYADEIDKMSIRTGLARQSLQELKFISDQAGVEFTGLEKAVQRLFKSMGDAEYGSIRQVEAFKALNLSVTDASGEMKSMSDMFPELMGRLGEIENESQRNAIAMELFGRSALNVVPLLTELGEDGIRDLTDKAHELGLVMSDEGIAAMVEYKDVMSQVTQSFQAAGRELAMGFMKIVKDTFLPLLRDNIIPAIRSLASWFSNLNPAVQRTTMVIAGIAAAVGPVLTIIGFMASNVIPGLIAAFSALRGAILSLFTIIAANPFTTLAVVLGAAAGAMLLFKKRSEDAAQAQHELGTAIDGVNKAVGEQIWNQLVNTFKKNTDGTVDLVGSMDMLKDSIYKMTRGELKSLQMFLKDQLATAMADTKDASSELMRQLGQQNVDKLSEALAIVEGRLGDFKTTSETTSTSVEELKKEVSDLESQLWEEVIANDANADATARLIKAKKAEIQVYNDLYEAKLKSLQAVPSITPSDDATQIPQDTAPSAVNLETGDSTASAFVDEYQEMADATLDISNQISGAVQQMADSVGASFEQMAAGTADTRTIFVGLLQTVASFIGTFGKALVAAGVGALAFQTQLLINPAGAIAAGLALVALAGAVRGLLSQGLTSNSNENRGQAVPRLAKGGLANEPITAIVGDNPNTVGNNPEVISPLNNLVGMMQNALAPYFQRYFPETIPSTSPSSIPITLDLNVTGKTRGEDIHYAVNKYSAKIGQLR